MAEEMMPEGEAPEAEKDAPAADAPAAEAPDAESVMFAAMALMDAIVEKGLPGGLTSIAFEGLDTDEPRAIAKGAGEPVEIALAADELARRVGAMAGEEGGE
jgi:hypothetical protein